MLKIIISVVYGSSLSVLLMWLLLTILFAILVFISKGSSLFLDFITAYLFELSFSIDNVVIFMLILRYLKIPAVYQNNILFVGILSTFFIRLLILFCGFYIIKFSRWIFIPIGILLIFSGVKLQKSVITSSSLKKYTVPSFIKNFLVVRYDILTDKFFYIHDGIVVISRLGIAFLLMIQADIILAFDSISAILVITDNLFIAFSSNFFALMGLRSMYKIVSNIVDKFHYFNNTIGMMLIYMGFKVLLSVINIEIDILLSMIIMLSILLFGVLLSLLKNYQ